MILLSIILFSEGFQRLWFEVGVQLSSIQGGSILCFLRILDSVVTSHEQAVDVLEVTLFKGSRRETADHRRQALRRHRLGGDETPDEAFRECEDLILRVLVPPAKDVLV